MRSQNLPDGDALTMRTNGGQPITFTAWGHPGAGTVPRRDVRIDTLTQSSAFSAKGSHFTHLSKHETFTPRGRICRVSKDGDLSAISGVKVENWADAPKVDG